MSGTSADGVDAVLVDLANTGWLVLAHQHVPFLGEYAHVKEEILALNKPNGMDELHRGALLANALARISAQAVQAVLCSSGVDASTIRAIGAHGQTVRHQPQQFDGTGYTLQLNNPALLAELTGIDVVADFRTRDVAAGGQGAPLAPLFHQAWLRSVAQQLRPNVSIAVLNLGGMANVTLLNDDGGIVGGFDTGPANVLMDGWAQQYLQQPYDKNGNWAASGTVIQPLLDSMLAEPYFAQVAPKSTGRDLFSRAWLMHHLQATGCWNNAPMTKPEDVQATLLELTACSVVDAVQHAASGLSGSVGRLLLCGGGAYNVALRKRLLALLPSVTVSTTDDVGLPAQQVEAVAFAWLAHMCVQRVALPVQRVTGARGARVLGALYAA